MKSKKTDKPKLTEQVYEISKAHGDKIIFKEQWQRANEFLRIHGLPKELK